MKQFLSVFAICLSFLVQAEEGMWLPQLLQKLNIEDMKANGCKLSAEDIYSINQPSLKDAIVSFGGYCTGEIISDEGLLLTNHHCGIGAIQSHSDHLEHNYLRDGFWAMDKAQELPVAGLHVTFIVKIEEVTDEILKHVTNEMSESVRKETVDNAIKAAKKKYTEGTNYGAVIKPFFEGLKYYMFITEKFEDIRMVGAPPEDLGSFGGDTDNWKWPRHTCDFSMFRIYADSNNNAAKYSPNNKPYVPKKSLAINAKGIKEGDFTMVFGFPGRTNEYLPSYSIDHIVNTLNPARIKIRESKMDILSMSMKTSEKIKVQYTPKFNRLTNAYKKWQGENRGIKRFNGIERKQEQEKLVQEWINKDTERSIKYKNLFEDFASKYANYNVLDLTDTYIYEALYGIEAFQLANRLTKIENAFKDTATTEEELNKQKKNFFSYLEKFHKDYHKPTDIEVYIALTNMYKKNIDSMYVPKSLFTLPDNIDFIFAESYLLDENQVKMDMTSNMELFFNHLNEDPLYESVKEIEAIKKDKIKNKKSKIKEDIDLLKRKYMQAQFEMSPEKSFYPNANSTLRVSYGQVKSYNPKDGVRARHYTTLKGVVDKYNPDHIDFNLPQKIIDLFKNNQLGSYHQKGILPTAFIASNHTTGGNSGSPILNAKGELIGLNFDRNWEGTMSDLMYNPDQCRNIGVDIRYVLFIIEQFAEAGHLLEEMKIID